ncbi:lysophospholipid acyltransferase family protein [Thermomicrobium sp. 4228-Ro]|uniref:lysophospholipid acyltransferase family protein n=1 Tax=Thermomicrobium sp. 4228-Ro TaxID=2993937 RepID=UPI002248EC1B|nr:lysophospholipid acyltransferase family protein [Thermomicrobium sp. 4228-Ro]MCX2727488.1 lysophospholipid acyltransferase family protein [Thermomicrobium sp. 4228-Ro]
MTNGDRFHAVARTTLVRCGQVLADFAGSVAFWLCPRYRHAAACNLAQVLGEPPYSPVVRRAVQGAFRASARNFLALLTLRLASGFWSPSVELEWSDGVPRVGEGPIVFVSAHLGPFDVVAALLSKRGYTFLVLAEPMRPVWLDRCVRWLRGHRGVTLVSPSPAGFRAVIRALRSGIPVVFLIDRASERAGRSIRFFGRAAWFSDVPIRLARRFGCPVVPVFAQRTGYGYRVSVAPAIDLAARDEAHVTELGALEQVVAQLEQAIRAAPDQWLVFRPVWSVESVL